LESVWVIGIGINGRPYSGRCGQREDYDLKNDKGNHYGLDEFSHISFLPRPLSETIKSSKKWNEKKRGFFREEPLFLQCL
jgi:hypothetical protein